MSELMDVSGLSGHSFDKLDHLPGGYVSDRNKAGRFWVCDHFVSSRSGDQGDSYQLSNRQVFREQFGALEAAGNVFFLRREHGLDCLVFDRLAEWPTEVVEFLSSLEDYPLANELRHSDLWAEIENIAFEQWGRKEFSRAIEKEFEGEELLPEIDDDALGALFWHAGNESGIYCEEMSEGPTWDFRSMVRWLNLDDIRAAANGEDLS